MPYIDLAGLSRYASRQKDRLERDYALLRDMQWTRSEKAGAVSLWPVGGTELKPSVDFMFTEVPPASGDKSPSNPSTISGVSSVAVGRCGKNLMREQLWTRNDDMTCVVGADGTVTFNGTGASYDSFYAYTFNPTLTKTNFPSYIKPGGTYRISASGNSYPNVHFQIYSVSSPTAAWGNTLSYAVAGESKTFTVPNDSIGMLFRYAIGRNVTVSNATLRVQIEEGSVETEYEKPIVNDYTLPLGSTYYGGSIDLATGVMTVTWWGHVFDGTETWRENGTVGTNYRHWVRLSENGFPAPVTGSAYQRCSHCTYYYSFNASLGRFFANEAESGGGIFFDDKDAVYPSTESWVSWLASEYAAGHPVVVTYQLTTPYTVQLTPAEILSLAQADKYTPRLNTVYTDAQAVQAGYVKSPIRDEYELQQAVIAQGGNV